MESNHHQKSQSLLYYHYTKPVCVPPIGYSSNGKRKNLNTASGPYTLAFALITGLRVSGLFFGLLETLFRLAGDSGFEPLQTRSQSPPNCHYSNPQYTQDTFFSIVLPIVLFSKLAGKIGLEPITHRLCNLLYMSCGAGYRNRTCDLMLVRHMLSQLS